MQLPSHKLMLQTSGTPNSQRHGPTNQTKHDTTGNGTTPANTTTENCPQSEHWQEHWRRNKTVLQQKWNATCYPRRLVVLPPHATSESCHVNASTPVVEHNWITLFPNDNTAWALCHWLVVNIEYCMPHLKTTNEHPRWSMAIPLNLPAQHYFPTTKTHPSVGNKNLFPWHQKTE